MYLAQTIKHNQVIASKLDYIRSMGVKGTAFDLETQYPMKMERHKDTAERSREKAVAASQEFCDCASERD